MTHKELVQRAVRWLRNTQGNHVVLHEQSSSGGETPDAIGWKRGASTLVEVKVSRADFHADKDKPWRRLPDLGMGAYRYYLTPPDLIKAEELPAGWGLLYAHKTVTKVVKKARRQSKRSSFKEIQFLSSALRRVQVRLGEFPLGIWLRLENKTMTIDDIPQVVQPSEQ